MLDAMIDAGTDLVRLNFSHGDPQSFVALAEKVRKRAEARGRTVGVLADLQGPKIRIARFREGAVTLTEGELFALDTAHDSEAGDDQCVGVGFKTLHEDVEAGDTLLLDDGRIVLTVTAVNGTRVDCQVDVGGVLSDNKGINRLGGGLSAEALTEKDKADILSFGKDFR
jgi:pyruvate kinase